jgi:ethanolamine utilization cobalamin adenosyltransferase
MNFFPTQAITELASEFKLLRKDIQAIKTAVQNIEQALKTQKLN